jgi:GT2 family glycosyltransferase
MNILALMPCYKIMEIDAVKSLTAFQADIYSRGDHLHIVYINGFNAVMARTMLAKYAAENPADWVIWLDSDHIYKASDLYALIERCEKDNLPMLSANYYLKSPGKVSAHTRLDAVKGHFTQAELTGDIVECDIVGFGFLVMRGSFIKEMVDKYGNDLFLMDNTNNTTEDVYFCRKVLECGNKVLFHSGITVGHLMTVVNI